MTKKRSPLFHSPSYREQDEDKIKFSTLKCFFLFLFLFLFLWTKPRCSLSGSVFAPQKSIYQTWPHIATTSKVETTLNYRHRSTTANAYCSKTPTQTQTQIANNQHSTAASWACQHACATSKHFYATSDTRYFLPKIIRSFQNSLLRRNNASESGVSRLGGYKSERFSLSLYRSPPLSFSAPSLALALKAAYKLPNDNINNMSHRQLLISHTKTLLASIRLYYIQHILPTLCYDSRLRDHTSSALES